MRETAVRLRDSAVLAFYVAGTCAALGVVAAVYGARLGWLELTEVSLFTLSGLASGRTALLIVCVVGLAIADAHLPRRGRRRGPAPLTSPLVLALSWCVAFASLNDADAARETTGAKVEQLGDRLYWCGETTLESGMRIAKLLSADRRPTLVLMNNVGGSSLAGLFVARVVSSTDAPVEVVGLCASACTLAWFAASDRVLRSESIVAVHGATIQYKDFVVRDESTQQAMHVVMVAGGVPEESAQRLLGHLGDDAAWLASKDLHELGVGFADLPRHPADAMACRR